MLSQDGGIPADVILFVKLCLDVTMDIESHGLVVPVGSSSAGDAGLEPEDCNGHGRIIVYVALKTFALHCGGLPTSHPRLFLAYCSQQRALVPPKVVTLESVI